jgi:hypothetical protein
VEKALETKIIKIERVESPWYFLGYVRNEGDMWTLIGFSKESEVDALVQKFRDTGKVTLEISYGRSSEVIEPVAVAKLTGTEAFYKVPKESKE